MGLWLGKKRRWERSADFEIAPDEVLIDSHNLPNLDEQQFEGRIEKPIPARSLLFAAFVFALVGGTLLFRVYVLQVEKGEAYAILAERNSLRHEVIIAPRGIIYDRTNEKLAWNDINEAHPEFPSRKYSELPGLAHVLGYVEYPKRDTSGRYYSFEYVGKDGVEAYFDGFLAGQNGKKIAETNALGSIESESTIELPRYGNTLRLSIDADVSSALHGYIKSLAEERGFIGGSGVIMDIENGELLALTSYPEYSGSIMSEGDDEEAIEGFMKDTRKPFLDRAISGLYTPGSIVKPFLALAALEEGIISPEQNILSTGSISIPNPYDPKKKSVFNDWKAHGYVDMREAIAVSSDVYFYEVGGGFEKQPGLGIGRIERYLRMFGFGSAEEGNFLLPQDGVIPNPTWKAEAFDGDSWRIGDTYNTSIGQYGMQVTPLQAVRATAALVNGGKLLSPTVLLSGQAPPISAVQLSFHESNSEVVKEGMRQAVLSGTASGLNIPGISVGAKTGTAEIDSRKRFVNSWVIGFFPYEKPRYAFAVVMERGPHSNTVGALFVMRQLLEWMTYSAPEYLK